MHVAKLIHLSVTIIIKLWNISITPSSPGLFLHLSAPGNHYFVFYHYGLVFLFQNFTEMEAEGVYSAEGVWLI